MALALGFAPPLAVLAGVAAAGVMAAAGAGSAALVWAVAPAAAAALLIAASAWWTFSALRRAASVATPAEPRSVAPADARAPATTEADADTDADGRIEIDHKVRNTLQIVTSLLSLELRGARQSCERAALLRVQARLFSLSLVHRRCSALDMPASVRLDLLAAEIADHLFADRAPDAAPVRTDPPLDPISAAPERATAFALFVNEALMNARDRLDRAKAAGPVWLSLRAAGGGACLLSIRDASGGALAAVTDDSSLGARLMANCAEQLGATLSAGRLGKAYEVRLAIPPEPLA